jgi:hypothetical protein
MTGKRKCQGIFNQLYYAQDNESISWLTRNVLHLVDAHLHIGLAKLLHQANAQRKTAGHVD